MFTCVVNIEISVVFSVDWSQLGALGHVKLISSHQAGMLSGCRPGALDPDGGGEVWGLESSVFVPCYNLITTSDIESISVRPGHLC